MADRLVRGLLLLVCSLYVASVIGTLTCGLLLFGAWHALGRLGGR